MYYNGCRIVIFLLIGCFLFASCTKEERPQRHYIKEYVPNYKKDQPYDKALPEGILQEPTVDGRGFTLSDKRLSGDWNEYDALAEFTKALSAQGITLKNHRSLNEDLLDIFRDQVLGEYVTCYVFTLYDEDFESEANYKKIIITLQSTKYQGKANYLSAIKYHHRDSEDRLINGYLYDTRIKQVYEIAFVQSFWDRIFSKKEPVFFDFAYDTKVAVLSYLKE